MGDFTLGGISGSMKCSRNFPRFLPVSSEPLRRDHRVVVFVAPESSPRTAAKLNIHELVTEVQLLPKNCSASGRRTHASYRHSGCFRCELKMKIYVLWGRDPGISTGYRFLMVQSDHTGEVECRKQVRASSGVFPSGRDQGPDF